MPLFMRLRCLERAPSFADSLPGGMIQCVVKFFSKPYCLLCDDVRTVLDESGLNYEEIDITLLEPGDERGQAYRNEIPVLERGTQRWFYRERLTLPLKEWLLLGSEGTPD